MTQTKPDSLYVRQLPLGPMKNFVYLVGPPTGRAALVIDPAWDVPAILSAAEADGRTLVVSGRVTRRSDRPTIFNPTYEILPVGS